MRKREKVLIIQGFRHLKGFKRPFKTIKFKSNYKSEK